METRTHRVTGIKIDRSGGENAWCDLKIVTEEAAFCVELFARDLDAFINLPEDDDDADKIYANFSCSVHRVTNITTELVHLGNSYCLRFYIEAEDSWTGESKRTLEVKCFMADRRIAERFV